MYCNNVRVPIDDGIEPVNLSPWKSKYARLVNCPKNVGNAAAVKELKPRSKYSRWVSLPIQVETVPVSELP